MFIARQCSSFSLLRWLIAVQKGIIPVQCCVTILPADSNCLILTFQEHKMEIHNHIFIISILNTSFTNPLKL